MQGSDYVLETLDQMRYVFNSSGHIRYAEDFKGNRVTIATGADGRILSLSDPAGAAVAFGYSGDRLTSITDSKSGRSVSYTYSGEFLTRAVDAGGFATTYTYTDGFLTGITDNSGRRVLTLTYSTDDYPGKVHTVADATGNSLTYEYDRISMQTIITDANGRETRQGYGLDFALTTSVNALGYAERINYLVVDGRNKYTATRITV